MPGYNGLTDGAFRDFASNFASVAAANAAKLGLSAADVTAINGASNGFTSALTSKTTAYDAAQASTGLKNDARQSMLDLIRLWANQWQSDPSIEDDVKQELGLPIHDTTPSPRPVFVPTNLVAEGNAAGANFLNWSRNGNFPNTNFIVEVSYDFSGVWSYVATTTKGRYTHLNQTPGQPAVYRVYAERPTGRSLNSNTAGVYIGGSSESSSSEEEAAA